MSREPGRLTRSLRQRLGLLRSMCIYWRPGRQRSLRRLYHGLVPADGLVFDVGAHLGDRTLAFAALGARVVALEPQPALHAWLRRRLAGHPNVVLRTEALGPRPGSAELAVSEATPTVSTLAHDWRRRIGGANPSFRHVAWEGSVRVPVTTLDALIAEYGRPAFCKIDVEGYEAAVLAGLGRPLPALSFEFVHGSLDVAEACIERLLVLGDYRFNVICGESRRFRFDAWLDASALRARLRGELAAVSSGDVYARWTGTTGTGASGGRGYGCGQDR